MSSCEKNKNLMLHFNLFFYIYFSFFFHAKPLKYNVLAAAAHQETLM